MVQSLRSPRIVGFVGLRPWDDNQKTWRGDELRRTQIQRVVGEVSRFIDSWIIILVAKFSWVFAVQTLLLVNSAVELFNLSWVDSKKNVYYLYIYMAQNPSAQPPHQPGQLLHVLLELRHGLILCGPPSSHSAIRGKSNPERSVANHITGWWYTYPSEKWWTSSVGMIIPFPIWWESHFNPAMFQSPPSSFLWVHTRCHNRCQKTHSSARTGRCLHPDQWRDNCRD